MTLTERLRKAQGCSREDDPTQHDKPRTVVPLWVQRAKANALPTKDYTGKAA